MRKRLQSLKRAERLLVCRKGKTRKKRDKPAVANDDDDENEAALSDVENIEILLTDEIQAAATRKGASIRCAHECDCGERSADYKRDCDESRVC